jgi:hypothetical protein
MLTIPEEFLLLTLRDEEGGFVDILPQASAAGFVGAAIMELALQNRVDSDLEKIWVVDKTPIGEASVDVVLAKIAAPGFDPATDRLIDQLVDTGPHVRELALQRLVSDGARLSSTEMALFELLIVSGTTDFKFIASLVR